MSAKRTILMMRIRNEDSQMETLVGRVVSV